MNDQQVQICEQLRANVRADVEAIIMGEVEPSIAREEAEFMVPFYLALKAVRIRLRIKQEDLGARLGVTQMVMSKYENGVREPSRKLIAAWRRELGQ